MKRLIAIAVLATVLIGSTSVASAKDDYQNEIKEISEMYGICPELVESIIFTESSGNPKAVSSCGATGLMQIRPEFHQDRMERLGVTDLTDPYQNILCGVDYIMELSEKYQDIYLVLCAYNAGEYSQAMVATMDGCRYPYSDKVLSITEDLEREHGK